eukprot:8049464-Alexandrium_andersonii.AAC.1
MPGAKRPRSSGAASAPRRPRAALQAPPGGAPAQSQAKWLQLPENLAALPLSERTQPFLPVVTEVALTAAVRNRLRAMLPPGRAVADVALERLVWRLAVGRALAEAAELENTGRLAQADSWRTALAAAGTAREAALRRRRE